MDKVLHQCRIKFGSPPRHFSLWEQWGYLRMPPPAWITKRKSDEMWEIYHQKRKLLMCGKVVWGCVVQANERLFRPGKLDSPAMLVYSPDTYYDNQPELLVEMASHLFALKGTQSDDPEVDAFAKVITNEMERAMRNHIPMQISHGRDVFTTCVMVHRRHIPNRMLSQTLLPLIILPEQTKATIILPSRYWSNPLLRAWES